MIYVVKSGDTLFKIAQTYTGDGNRYREILPGNPQITDPNFIEIGDLLNIPQSWIGPNSVSAVNTSAPPSEEGMSANSKVILVALVAAGAAAAYWYYGRGNSEALVSANPEDDSDDGDFEHDGE